MQPGVSLECGDLGRLKDKLSTLHFWKQKRSKKVIHRASLAQANL